MAQPRKRTRAFAAVVQCVFLEGFRQPVTRGGSNSRDPKVGAKSLAVTFSALIPLRWRIGQLVDSGGERGADNWIRTECVENVVVYLCSFRRPDIGSGIHCRNPTAS